MEIIQALKLSDDKKGKVVYFFVTANERKVQVSLFKDHTLYVLLSELTSQGESVAEMQARMLKECSAAAAPILGDDSYKTMTTDIEISSEVLWLLGQVFELGAGVKRDYLGKIEA